MFNKLFFSLTWVASMCACTANAQSSYTWTYSKKNIFQTEPREWTFSAQSVNDFRTTVAGHVQELRTSWLYPVDETLVQRVGLMIDSLNYKEQIISSILENISDQGLEQLGNWQELEAQGLAWQALMNRLNELNELINALDEEDVVRIEGDQEIQKIHNIINNPDIPTYRQRNDLLNALNGGNFEAVAPCIEKIKDLDANQIIDELTRSVQNAPQNFRKLILHLCSPGKVKRSSVVCNADIGTESVEERMSKAILDEILKHQDVRISIENLAIKINHWSWGEHQSVEGFRNALFGKPFEERKLIASDIIRANLDTLVEHKIEIRKETIESNINPSAH